MSSSQNYPNPRRKISFKAKQSVDEILQVVADQGRKTSLSGTDYRIQKRLERMASQSEMGSEEAFDDASSFATSSDLSTSSYSPPPTQGSAFSDFSWSSVDTSSSSLDGNKPCRVAKGLLLPPLDPAKPLKRPSRPPPRSPSRRETLDGDDHVELKRPPRPSSARGPRTVPRMRGLTIT